MATIIIDTSIGPQGPRGLPGVGEEDMPYSKRVDFVNDYVYIGEADPGALESASVWRIRRLEILEDGDVITLWADGNSLFDHIWASRLSLTFQ